MKYSEIRNTIKTGDIITWSVGGPWNSWRNIQLNLIKYTTASPYNHIGIAYVVAGRVFVIDAVVPHIRIFPLSRLMPFYFIRTPFVISEQQEEKMLKFIGLPYSKWEAIKAAFSKDTNNPNKWQCAKLVNEILKDFDEGFGNLNDTPGTIVNYLNNKYNIQLDLISE